MKMLSLSRLYSVMYNTRKKPNNTMPIELMGCLEQKSLISIKENNTFYGIIQAPKRNKIFFFAHLDDYRIEYMMEDELHGYYKQVWEYLLEKLAFCYFV